MSKNNLTRYNASTENLIITFLLLYKRESDVDCSTLNLPSTLNQEKEFMRKEAYEQLSEDAKEIVQLIFSSRKEVLELITTEKFKSISKNLIQKYLLKYRRWKKEKINKAFRELSRYTNQLE